MLWESARHVGTSASASITHGVDHGMPVKLGARREAIRRGQACQAPFSEEVKSDDDVASGVCVSSYCYQRICCCWYPCPDL